MGISLSHQRKPTDGLPPTRACRSAVAASSARGLFVVLVVALVVALALALSGCDDGTDADGSGGDDNAAVGDSSSADAAAAAADASADDAAAGADASPPSYEPTKAYTGGDCPNLMAGENKLWSWEGNRKVLIYLPHEPKGAPLLFLWHGLGDTPENFAAAFNAAGIANKYNTIVAVPGSNGKFPGWGFSSKTAALPDGALFDDILTCLDDQYDVDNRRVYSMGFSAGGLWTTWLQMHRSKWLAAVLAFSGGTGEFMNVYETPASYVPTLLTSGGVDDNVAGVAFAETSLDFATHLLADGQYVIHCDHGLGHTVPWGADKWAVPFLFAHEWGVIPSPYLANAKDAGFPDYCVIP